MSTRSHDARAGRARPEFGFARHGRQHADRRVPREDDHGRTAGRGPWSAQTIVKGRLDLPVGGQWLCPLVAIRIVD